ASKNAGSPGQAIRSVPPYLGCCPQPRLVPSTTTTSRLHHTSQRVFIGASCVRKPWAMRDGVEGTTRRCVQKPLLSQDGEAGPIPLTPLGHSGWHSRRASTARIARWLCAPPL